MQDEAISQYFDLLIYKEIEWKLAIIATMSKLLAEQKCKV